MAPSVAALTVLELAVDYLLEQGLGLDQSLSSNKTH